MRSVLCLIALAACARPPQPKPPRETSFVVAHTSGSTSEGTGDIAGVVMYASGPEPAVGITVVAASPVLQGAPTAFTDNAGHFQFLRLPPGSYTLTLYWSEGSRVTTVDVRTDMTARSTVANFPDPTGGTLLGASR